MASSLYTNFLDLLLKGDIDLLSDTIKAVLVDTGSYTFSAAHSYLSSVASGARISTATLSGKGVSGGVFDAADTLFTGVTGSSIEAIVLYKDTGSDASSPLIAYLDGYTGLPYTPSGADLTITWPNTAGKILKLAVAV